MSMPLVGQAGAFNGSQLRMVAAASSRAAALVSGYYRVSPREWHRMPYEVRTRRSLASSEVTDAALAQTICYGFRTQVGETVVAQGELFRICLQDHVILEAAEEARCGSAGFRSLLTHVLTHELVHVVRFGQLMQHVDLPIELRLEEEMKVERATRAILASQRTKASSRRLPVTQP